MAGDAKTILGVYDELTDSETNDSEGAQEVPIGVVFFDDAVLVVCVCAVDEDVTARVDGDAVVADARRGAADGLEQPPAVVKNLDDAAPAVELARVDFA